MGKLIVHWSPLHGQAKTTSSMSAVALAMAEKNHVCVTHTQGELGDLEGMYDGRIDAVQRAMLYEASGLKALITNMKRGKIDDDDIDSCAVTVPGIKTLELLPGVDEKELLYSNTEIGRILLKIISSYVKKKYDYTFVDLAAGHNELSKHFMEQADLIVVTLSQNRAMWEFFFEKYPEIARKQNVFYLLGGTDKDSAYGPKNFSRMYRAFGVRLKRVGTIPANVGYMDAISEGTVAPFYASNMKALKGDENMDFIDMCRETAGKIEQYLALCESGKAGDVT